MDVNENKNQQKKTNTFYHPKIPEMTALQAEMYDLSPLTPKYQKWPLSKLKCMISVPSPPNTRNDRSPSWNVWSQSPHPQIPEMTALQAEMHYIEPKN